MSTKSSSRSCASRSGAGSAAPTRSRWGRATSRRPASRSFTTGTPPILGLTAARAGIELSIEAGIDAIRAKSTQLTEYAIELADELLAPLGVTVGSPRDSTLRGGHVALVHEHARTLTTQLADRNVLADFRAPDVIRIGLSPLTTRFTDVHDGLQALRDLLSS